MGEDAWKSMSKGTSSLVPNAPVISGTSRLQPGRRGKMPPTEVGWSKTQGPLNGTSKLVP